MIESYKELKVWQRGVDLVLEIYKLTALFPKEETYGIVSQLRRAAVSIPSNIAEGFRRRHKPEYLQFVRISFGSGAEIETQLVIAKKLKLAPERDFAASEIILEETMKMLNSLSRSLS